MSKKSGSGLEKYIDKIVLGVAGLIGLYVLYAYVLNSPITVMYNGTQYNPSDVDKAIRDQARLIEDELAKKATSEAKYQPKFPDFESMLASPINGINSNVYIWLPSAEGEKIVLLYDIPKVCDVNDVKARLVTTVAYVPKKPLEGNDSYAAAETEPLDLDFVTVEATVNAAELSRRFAQSFATSKNPAWTRPVFAAVQLERQELLKDGKWSDWRVVPRTKIDDFRERFNIPQKASKLGKSIEILMLQFDKPEMREQMLQPRAYDFAYPVESWLPPTLSAKRQEKLDKDKEADRRRRMDEAHRADEARTQTRSASRPAASTPASGRPAAPPSGAGGGGLPGAPGLSAPPVRQPQPTRPTPTNRPAATPATTAVDRGTHGSGTKVPAVRADIATWEQEFTKLKITDKTDFAAMKESLLIWSHDDTTEPSKTYRYRMRVGVFDPAAGTNSFNDRDKSLKDDVVLWSNYSGLTEPVAIPSRWYFFPLNYREADKMVNMTVCRYLLAKWYSKDIKVKPGEMIGSVVENAKTEDAAAYEPNEINYSNGTILVDVVPAVNNDYANALYAANGMGIEPLAAKQQYWPADLKSKFAEIERVKKEQKDQPPVFVPRGSTPVNIQTPQTSPGMPGMPGGMPGVPGQ